MALDPASSSGPINLDGNMSALENISIPDDMIHSVETLNINLGDDSESSTEAQYTPEASDDEDVISTQELALHPLDEKSLVGEDTSGASSDTPETTSHHRSEAADGFADDEKTAAGEDSPPQTEPSAASPEEPGQPGRNPDESPWEELRKWLVAHPVQAAALGISTVAIASPMTLAAPALGLVGFGSSGVAASTIAAAWQSSIGLVAQGSLFSLLQSAGAGGVLGTSAVSSVVSMTGLGGVFGVVGGLFGRKKDSPERDSAGAMGTSGNGGGDDGGHADLDDEKKRFLERWLQERQAAQEGQRSCKTSHMRTEDTPLASHASS